MTIVGGVLGVLLVSAMFMFRPATSPSFDDPVGLASFPPPPFEPLGPDRLYEAYSRLGPVTVGGLPATLSVSRADNLVLPSGRVLASDAFYLDTPPFTVSLPAGKHPVLLLHVSGGQIGPNIAAAMVRVEGGNPVRWEGARTGASAPGTGPYVHAVDSGTSAFASAESVARMSALPRDGADALVDQLIDGYRAGVDYTLTATITVDQASGANIVTFSSGYGDGGYPSWFGFDSRGTAIALLTSFDLVDDPSTPPGSRTP